MGWGVVGCCAVCNHNISGETQFCFFLLFFLFFFSKKEKGFSKLICGPPLRGPHDEAHPLLETRKEFNGGHVFKLSCPAHSVLYKKVQVVKRTRVAFRSRTQFHTLAKT